MKTLIRQSMHRLPFLWHPLKAFFQSKASLFLCNGEHNYLGCPKNQRNYTLFYFADLHDVKNITDPMSKVKPGLVATGDTPIDLKGVHIRAKMLDMASEVM